MFRSKKTTLESSVSVMVYSLSGLDQLNEEEISRPPPTDGHPLLSVQGQIPRRQQRPTAPLDPGSPPQQRADPGLQFMIRSNS